MRKESKAIPKMLDDAVKGSPTPLSTAGQPRTGGTAGDRPSLLTTPSASRLAQLLHKTTNNDTLLSWNVVRIVLHENALRTDVVS
jgi:hypothetical protein